MNLSYCNMPGNAVISASIKYLVITISNKERYTNSIKDNINNIELFNFSNRPYSLICEICGFENLTSLENSKCATWRPSFILSIAPQITWSMKILTYCHLWIRCLDKNDKLLEQASQGQIWTKNIFNSVKNSKKKKQSAIVILRGAKLLPKFLEKQGFYYLWLMTSPENEIYR